MMDRAVQQLVGPLPRRKADASGIEVWNVTDGIASVTGALERFLVIGTVAEPASLDQLTYSLNGSAERPVVVRRDENPGVLSRLSAVGDFSIDTIAADELQPINELRLTARTHDGEQRTRYVSFAVESIKQSADGVRLDVERSEYPQQLCQLVDGRWQRATDADGRPCLRISTADAGYDRVALFTPPTLEPPYTLSMRVRVEKWTRRVHNVGLVFGWRDHLSGDGHVLPRDWTTGLGYYYSHSPGLRLRVGESVRYDDAGRKFGDRVLAERPLSRRRELLARASDRIGGGTRLRQIATGRDYWFRLRATPTRYALSVWPAGRPEPAAQVTAPADEVAAPIGAGGIIAHHCAVNVYEYHYDVGAGDPP